MTQHNQNDSSYDIIVIGAGAAGSTATSAFKKAGLRTAWIERDHMGGTCLNYGCDPTKTMLHTAGLLHDMRQSERYAIHSGEPALDWAALQRRIRGVQHAMLGGSYAEAREKQREQGIDFIRGEARFVSPHEIVVNGPDHDGTRLRAKQFLLAVGAKERVPPTDGLKEAGYLTNREIIYLDEPPRRLAIFGSGPIGVEFAQMFNRFGTEVIIFEKSDRILSKDDRELAAIMRGLLEEEGIRIQTGATPAKVQAQADGKRIDVDYDDGRSESHVVDAILIAVGRTPAIAALNLDAAGVECDEESIGVDKLLRTNVPHIWAAGDAVTKYRFTHVAEVQGERVGANMIDPDNAQPYVEPVIPWVTYTMPELAHVGQTAEQLDEAGASYRVASAEMEENPRALAMGKPYGKVKLLVGDDDQILGGHILSPNAGEMIAPVILAMQAGLAVSALSDTVFPYPTLSEAVGSAAASLAS